MSTAQQVPAQQSMSQHGTAQESVGHAPLRAARTSKQKPKPKQARKHHTQQWPCPTPTPNPPIPSPTSPTPPPPPLTPPHGSQVRQQRPGLGQAREAREVGRALVHVRLPPLAALLGQVEQQRGVPAQLLHVWRGLRGAVSVRSGWARVRRGVGVSGVSVRVWKLCHAWGKEQCCAAARLLSGWHGCQRMHAVRRRTCWDGEGMRCRHSMLQGALQLLAFTNRLTQPTPPGPPHRKHCTGKHTIMNN